MIFVIRKLETIWTWSVHLYHTQYSQGYTRNPSTRASTQNRRAPKNPKVPCESRTKSHYAFIFVVLVDIARNCQIMHNIVYNSWLWSNVLGTFILDQCYISSRELLLSWVVCCVPYPEIKHRLPIGTPSGSSRKYVLFLAQSSYSLVTLGSHGSRTFHVLLVKRSLLAFRQSAKSWRRDATTVDANSLARKLETMMLHQNVETGLELFCLYSIANGNPECPICKAQSSPRSEHMTRSLLFFHSLSETFPKFFAIFDSVVELLRLLPDRLAALGCRVRERMQSWTGT